MTCGCLLPSSERWVQGHCPQTPFRVGDADGGQPDALLAPLQRGKNPPQGCPYSWQQGLSCFVLSLGYGIRCSCRKLCTKVNRLYGIFRNSVEFHGVLFVFKGCGFPAAEVGGTGHGSAPVPQRRNLSSSNPRILPVFAATKSSAAILPHTTFHCAGWERMPPLSENRTQRPTGAGVFRESNASIIKIISLATRFSFWKRLLIFGLQRKF